MMIGAGWKEMVRLRQIMPEISGDSLLLMNESFSSTNAHEGCDCGRDT